IAAWGNSRTAKPGARWFAIGEAVGLAGLWSSLPTYAFATQPAHVQVVIGGAMAAMMGAAVALAALPAAALAWIATLVGAFCLAYYFGSWTLEPRLALDQPVGRSDRRHGRHLPGLSRSRPGRDRRPPHPGAADQPRQHGRALGPAQSRPRAPASRRGAVGLRRRRGAVRDHVPRSR